MTNVNVSPTLTPAELTHDIAISSRGRIYGMNFAGSGQMQRVPIGGTSTLWNSEQSEWNGGRGRMYHKTDPNGYYDANHAWTLQPNKLFAVPQIRHAKGLRNTDEFMPGDGTDSTVWKSLYAEGTTRYASVSYAASASYNAKYVRLIIRRVGTPGTLTVEHCPDSGGNPGTANKTVTLAASAVEANSTVSLSYRYKFSWSGTQAQTATTTYHIKVYGASTDNTDNHWEILVDNGTSGSKTSSNNSTWASASWKFYYRVCDTDVARRLKMFFLDGAWYAVSINDAGTASTIYINGDRKTVASATSTSVTVSGTPWTASRWSGDGAYMFIYAGKGAGQSRLITANTNNTLTVGTLDITPDTTSKFTIIHTRWWSTVTTTGTTLGIIVNAPACLQNVAIFPLGSGTVAQRMTSDHVVSNEGVYSDKFEIINDGESLNLWSAVYSTSQLQLFKIPASLTGVALLTKLAKTMNIGSSDYWINNIVGHDKKLYVMKENTMYSVEGTTIEEKSIAIKDMPSRLNGVAAVSQQNYLYWSWASSMERMIQSNASDIMNFKPNYSGMPTDRKSYPSSAANLLSWVLVAMDGSTSYTSSVLLWNDMGWMELLRGFETGSRIRDVFVQTTYEQRPRVWTCMDGDFVFQDMPLNDNNPLQDTGMQHEHEFSYVSGAMDGNELSQKKLVSRIETLCEAMTYGKLEIDFQTNEDVWTDKWKPLPETVEIASSEIYVGMGGLSKFAIRVRGYTTAPLTPTVLENLRVEGWKVDQARNQWMARVEVGHGLTTKRGEPDHDPDELDKWILEVSHNAQECTLHSRIASYHGKNVIIHIPSIAPTATDAKKWQGSISLMIREI